MNILLIVTLISLTSNLSVLAFDTFDKQSNEVIQNMDNFDSFNVSNTNSSLSKSLIELLNKSRKALEQSYSLVANRTKRSTGRRRKNFGHKNRLGNCVKQDFNVNFVELGWDKWILYPKIFNAHICSGSCSVPLPTLQKSYFQSQSAAVQVTNHAQIMSILEFKHPEINKQMTKCVSTKLKPLTIIFLDEYGQIKTKQYEDMVVEECGCR